MPWQWHRLEQSQTGESLTVLAVLTEPRGHPHIQAEIIQSHRTTHNPGVSWPQLAMHTCTLLCSRVPPSHAVAWA